MKVSIYIEENIQQVNLTPENEYERNIVKSIHKKENEIEFKYGSFQSCNGGWVMNYNRSETNEDSLFIVIKEKETK